MSTTIDIIVTDDVVKRATIVARELQASIGLSEPWTSLNAYLDPHDRLQQVRNAEATLGLDFRRCKLLELGSGMGMLVTVATKLGLDVTGSEPAANSYKSLREASDALLGANGVAQSAIDRSPGEALPWPDGTFDVVLSYQVLEHVRDPARTLREALRVLKAGGRLYFDMPNYHSLIEGHYGIAWLPPLAYSKPIAKAYVRLAGRNPAFLDEINFVTPRRVTQWLAPLTSQSHIASRPGRGPSPSTDDVTIAARIPALPAGQRYEGLAQRVRRYYRHPRIAPRLEQLGIFEHIVVTATK